MSTSAAVGIVLAGYPRRAMMDGMRVFNDEWLRRKITERELTDAIEVILEEIGT